MSRKEGRTASASMSTPQKDRIIANTIGKIKTKIPDKILARLKVPFGMALLVFCYALLLFYVFGRCFIVIEAFISLRSLPEQAFQTPSWTQWIPHL